MALTKFTLDTEKADFPFLSRLAKKGTVIPHLDQERVVPIPIYVDNVVPTAEGITSIGYLAYSNVFELDAPIDYEYYKAKVFPIYSSVGETGYIILDISAAKIKVYAPQVGISQVLEYASSEIVPSVFFFRDRSWLFHPDLGLRFINTEFQLEEQALEGINTANLLGMTSAISYLIGYDEDTIYWSDPINFAQFDPTPSTSNANFTSVLGVKGKINLVLAAPKGFVIYTDGNATRAKFTQNVRNPWVFDELKNSSGVANASQVTDYENLGTHFIWSNAGFGVVGDNSVEYPFSNLTELLAGDLIENIEFVQGNTEQEILLATEILRGQRYRTAVNFAANRYVAISYGEYDSVFSYVLLYDVHLQRWGRLKVDHVDVFNFIPPKKETDSPAENFFVDETQAAEVFFGAAAMDFLPKDFDFNFWGKDFAVLLPNGDVWRVTSNYKSDPAIKDIGVLIYGEIALTRGRYSELSEIEISGYIDYEEDHVEVHVRSKDTTFETFHQAFLDPQLERFVTRSVGRNHEILLRGKFNISTMVVSLIQQGII